MRVLKRNPWLTGLGTVLSLLGLWWGSARAAATTDQPASVLFFPKVIADGTRDTLIQITNTSNSPVEAHCEYVNATGLCSVSGAVCSLNSDCPVGQTCNDVLCQAGDFFIGLTKQQPTIWHVSTGRDPNFLLSNPPIGACDPTSKSCPGISFTQIPPPPGGAFRGYLVCYEVDDSDVPMGANAIKGEATIQTLGTAQISEYNAVGFRFLNATGPADETIALDGVEYDACPQSQLLDHYSERADDLVASSAAGPSCPGPGDCPVRTEIAMVPCSADFANNTTTTVIGQFNITNEFETHFSASTNVTCWWGGRLNQLNPTQFDIGTLGSTFAKSQVRSAFGFVCSGGDPTGGANNGATCNDDSTCTGGATCEPQAGLLSVVEDFHTSAITTTLGTAAANGFFVGSRGQCQINNNGFTGQLCSTDAECPTGQRCAVDAIGARVFDHNSNP